MLNERVSKALGESFRFTVKNTTGAKKVVAILAAFFDTLAVAVSVDGTTHVATVSKKFTDATEIVAAGYTCDYVLDDGIIVTDLTANSNTAEQTIRAFREYIKTCGGRVLMDMSVQANNAAAFNQAMKIVQCTPLDGAPAKTLPLSRFKSVDQSANDKVEVRGLDLPLGPDTLILLPIENGHEITIDFQF